MDAAEPPRIVFESPARCADGHRAEALLRQVLARARAPGHAWVVTMRIAASGVGVLRADGEIVNNDGVSVGHRAVIGKAGDCGGLARAIGVWASLVLDAEISRPRATATAEEQAPSAPPVDGKSNAPEAGAGLEPKAKPPPEAIAADPESEPAWPPPPPSEKVARRDDGPTLEIGAGAFLMTGMTGRGGGLLIGATPFLVIEVARGLFLRPAIAMGASLASPPPAIFLATTRGDACMRVAGLYTNLHGIQLDLCGGTDIGVLSADGRVLPYVAFGPSVDLRGELGGDLAVVLRGIVDVNAAHDSALDTPLWAGRAELAMSWRIR